MVSVGESAGEKERRWEGSNNNKELWKDIYLEFTQYGWIIVC